MSAQRMSLADFLAERDRLAARVAGLRGTTAVAVLNDCRYRAGHLQPGSSQDRILATLRAMVAEAEAERSPS